MLSLWKYVVLGSTIVGAILTPSTDPITQLCLSLAIFILYLLGSIILFIYQNTAL
jgi:sec-independent protein translocase protein TatC